MFTSLQHGVVVQILAGGGEQPSHLDEILERSVLDGVGNGLRLERHARANEIEQQLLRDRARVVRTRQHQDFFASADVDAGTVTDLDEPHRLELLERLANRRMSDAESPRHLHDRRQPVAALVVSLSNHRADSLRQLVRQTLLEYRAERVSHSSISGHASIIL